MTGKARAEIEWVLAKAAMAEVESAWLTRTVEDPPTDSLSQAILDREFSGELYRYRVKGRVPKLRRTLRRIREIVSTGPGELHYRGRTLPPVRRCGAWPTGVADRRSSLQRL